MKSCFEKNCCGEKGIREEPALKKEEKDKKKKRKKGNTMKLHQ